jgi:hypothetical protein
MDWIGDKLAQLIEEGKRALGREIVVMSEAQEDEVDDGSGNWIEEDDVASRASTSYGSPYTPSPMTPSPNTGYIGKRSSLATLRARASYVPKARHGKSRSDVGADGNLNEFSYEGGIGRSLPVSVPVTPNTISKFEVNTTPSSVREAEQDWLSPELRESMERARAAYRQKRGLGY